MNTDGLSRRVKSLEDTRTYGTRNAAAVLEQQDGEACRPGLERCNDPIWPPWPPEADGYHHAWVRANWTPEACDEYDFTMVGLSDIRHASMVVLAGCEAAGMTLAEAFAAVHLDDDLPAGAVGTVRDNLARVFGDGWAEDYDREVKGGAHARETWPAEQLAAKHEAALATLHERERVLLDPTPAERAKLLERRGIGIRGEGYDWRPDTQAYRHLASR